MKPADIRVPRGWTEEQAEAVLQFLFEIHEALWDEYGTRLKARWRRGSAQEPGAINAEADEPVESGCEEPPF